jgi:hypothetical protein
VQEDSATRVGSAIQQLAAAQPDTMAVLAIAIAGLPFWVVSSHAARKGALQITTNST